MCKTPKIIWIKSKNDVKHRLVVPCGKCTDCQNSKRAQFVARCKYELKDNPFCYFITFTYDDEHLINLFWKKSFVINKRRLIKKYLEEHNGKVFAYDKFLLNKDDAFELLKNIRSEFKKMNLFPKYYLTSEYGTLSHRPHMHALLFFPRQLDTDFLSKKLLSLWKRGNVSVYPAVDACINYVAKHQVKDDCGSKYQQKLAPIFALQSKKIGIAMLQDSSVLSNWRNGLRFGRIPNTSYKYALPRYIVKYFKPNGYTDDELDKMDSDGFDRLKHNLSLEGFEFDEGFFSTNKKFFHHIQSIVNQDFKAKLVYKQTKFQKKYINYQRSKQNNDVI